MSFSCHSNTSSKHIENESVECALDLVTKDDKYEEY